MTKKKITVLVNASAGYKSCVDFLSKLYNVNIIDCRDYTGDIKIDLMLFTGGEDVSPGYYGESVGKFTSFSKNRDSVEQDYMYCRSGLMDVPRLGICRGAQFLTVMNGGSLIQDVSGHALGGTHLLDMKYMGVDDRYTITSTHHQMMFPYNLEKENYQILATSTFFLSNTYLDGNNNEKKLPKNFEECEIVFYPKSRSLCIQGHPESDNCPSDTQTECLNLIRDYLNL